LLQPEGLKELPRRVRQKGLVILQSVELPPAIRARRAGLRKGRIFRVCVLGHLRAVKDPFRAALASRQLPWNSGIQVFQIGGATSDGFAKRAKAETEGNLRYRWAGEWPRGQALRFLAGCDALVLSSKMEGGANVISEAITIGVPVIASRIPGSVGLLGKNYPGFFPVGDTAALGKLLRRLETEPRFYRRLQQRCRELRSMFHPSRERRAWSQLPSEAFKNQRPRSP
jgi:glycosyltransferase involved in cell wall biosynthesis